MWFRIGLGELAALGTAFSWGITSHVHSVVSRMIGPNALVLLRTPFQMLLLLILALALEGFDLPAAFSRHAVLCIFLSSFFGLMMADICFYRSIMLVGPQMGVLLESTSSIFAAFLGFIRFGEVLSVQAVCGIVIVVIGVAAVLTAKGGNTLLPGQDPPKGRALAVGIGLGLGSAVFMACGFVAMKSALNEGISPLWASVLRVFFALVTLWTVGYFRGWAGEAVRGVRQYHKIFWILLGSNAVGSLGIWLSNVALANSPTGVASSLIGLQPIVVTFVGAVLYRKFPTFRVILGTLVAFGGTVLLCMR